jgi:hypothetical protein
VQFPLVKRWIVLALGLWPCLAALGQATGEASAEVAHEKRMLLEGKHFLECLAYVYQPALWVSYRDSLYFAPKTDAQARQIESLKAARARYVALTNREERYALAEGAIAESGLPENWKRKLLLPYSTTNQNLTPTLERLFRVIPTYKVLQNLGNGDALIQEGDAVYFVMDFGRCPADGSGTNAVLVREGTKTYRPADGETQRVEALTDIGLNRDEISVLNRAVAAFQKRAAALNDELASSKERQTFAESVARATDSNPYQQYLVARGFLEGKGTQTNETMGLDWMRRAAKNGSGDAKAYLEKLGQKPD